MAQSQEELQKRMASLVAELSGVMIQIESAGGTSGAAVSALLNPPAAASGIAATIAAAAAAAAAASPAPTAEVPAVVDPATAFSPAPFFVSSGGGEASATLEQDIANLISGTSGSAAPAAAPAPPPSAPTQQQRNNANNNNNHNNNYNGTSDMEKWMHQMMATHNGSQLTPHDVVTLLQQYMYGQQQQQPYGRGGYRGRGGAVPYGRGGGGGPAGRYGYPPYYAGNGRGSFPPAGSHFMGQYDGNYYADDGQEEMAHMVAVLYDQYMRMQRQGGTNGSNAQPPQGAQQQQQAPHQPPPQAQQQPPAVAKPPPAPPAQPVQPAQPVPAKQVQSPTGSSFRPNLSAKPFRPPGAQPVYGVPISASNNEMMQTAFSNQKELKLGGNNKEEVVEEEEVHQVTGANAPRKRKGRKTAIPPAAGNTPAPAPEDEDDSNTPMGYVEFKRQKIKKYPCSGVVQPGQYVMVDGDRGLDCGLLVQMTAFGKDGLLHVVTLEGFEIEESRMKPERGRIIRVAENHEVDKLHSEICTAEKTALRACRQRCSDLNLKIEVLDCEYQFDMKKVSFYFNSNTSVDFRDLVRDLYRNFNARIWMENINPNVKNVVPHGSRHH